MLWKPYMIKFECWLVPIFLYIFFILLNLPSKKHQNACANIGGKQNLRSENSRKWIESLKTCPPIHENAKNTTLKLESIHPCLHILTVLKPKLPSATFFRLHKCTKTWKWAQNTRLPWNQHKVQPPNENLEFGLKFRASARRKRVELDLDSRF